MLLPSKLTVRDAAISLLFAVFLGVLWPIHADDRIPVDLTITALGQKNAQSHSAEVWLLSYPAEMTPAALVASASPPGSWVQKDGAVVADSRAPVHLHWTGRLSPGAKLEFLSHSWSGLARVEVNGTSTTLDLYDPVGNKRLPAEATPAGAASPFRPGAYLAALAKFVLPAWLVVLAAIASLRMVWARARFEPAWPDEGGTVRYSWPSMAIFFVTALGTWPAQMSPDSIGQWAQLADHAYNNAHPVVATFLIDGPGYLAGTPGVSALWQAALLALSIGALIAELRRWGLPNGWAWFAAVAVPAFPAVHILSTVLWKDIPYTTAVVALTAMLLALARTRGEAARSKTFLFGLAAILFLAATLRHNGLVVTLGIIPVLIVTMRRYLPKRVVVICAAAGLAAPLAFDLVVLPSLGVSGIGRHYGGIVPIHALGQAVSRDLIDDQETRDRLFAIMPKEEWVETYNCLSNVPSFWAPGIRYDRIDASLFGPLLKIILHHPVEMAEHFVCVNSLLWRLSPTKDYGYSVAPLSIWHDKNSEKLGPSYSPVVPAVDRYLHREVGLALEPVPSALLWRPATMLLLVLGLALLCATWSNTPVILIALSPIVLNTLSLVPAMGSQDFRYQFPVTAIGLLLSINFVALGRKAFERALLLRGEHVVLARS